MDYDALFGLFVHRMGWHTIGSVTIGMPLKNKLREKWQVAPCAVQRLLEQEQEADQGLRLFRTKKTRSIVRNTPIE